MIVFVFACISLYSVERTEYLEKWSSYFTPNNKYNEAIPYYQKAIQEYPEISWFYVFLGFSHIQMSEFPEGIQNLEKAYSMEASESIRDNLAFAYYGYANHLVFKKNKIKESLSYYQKSIDLKNIPIFYNLYGNALRLNGEHEKAYRAFQKSFELDPELLKSTAGAEENFRESLITGLAHLYRDKNYEVLESYANLGRKYLHNRIEILDYLFKVYLDKKDFDSYRKLLNSLEDSGSKWVYAGILSFEESKESEANKFFEKASKSSKSYKIDKKIGDFLNEKIEHLNYSDQMNSPIHIRSVSFHSKSVKKYFKEFPYKQNQKFSPPLRNEFCIFQGEGGKSYHFGLYGHYSYDIGLCEGNSMGEKIYSIGDGKVIKIIIGEKDQPIQSKVDLKARANTIWIQHKNNLISTYSHIKQNSSVLKPGQIIKKGQEIAEIGNSGISAGPHLHFSLIDKSGTTYPVRFSNLKSRSRESPNSESVPNGILKESEIYTPDP